ncbi:hypothetical protein PSAN_10780 [Pseudomonas antarctica]|uniref:Short chain dehydrogenase n=1 Tax=Pseudomonas antarctica TaxID=219572 RepID=A0ABQ6ZW87_9PSED|nr:hypothetical protein PSAN_10780 [Pseudomonas antarctica]
MSKVVVITGASQGIGAAVVHALPRPRLSRGRHLALDLAVH